MKKPKPSQVPANDRWRDRYIKTVLLPAGSIQPHPRNPKIHGDAQIAALGGVLNEVGKLDSLKAYESATAGGKLVFWDGHARAGLDPDEKWRVDIYDIDDAEAEIALATFDPVGYLAQIHAENMAQIMAGIDTGNAELVQFLANQAASIENLQKSADPNKARPATLLDRFVVPPFTVLDARQGYWQKRKDQWLAHGIKSEIGRDELATFGDKVSDKSLNHYRNKKKGAAAVKPDPAGDATEPTQGTSIFDPVLCEIIYRWFSPTGSAVFDPFAGGSVRGIVASMLDRKYTGIDLRPEQIKANNDQAGEICRGAHNPPRWIIGDARNSIKLGKGAYDLIFTCPPYGDLERYSDDPFDLSTLNYRDFVAAFRNIVAQSIGLLRPNRFAAIVVGDFRDKKTGLYQNFVSDTIDAFNTAGARLYNEAILVTAIGSLPIRIRRQFETSRKLGKTHQNVLIFVKGDARKATEYCGKIEIHDPSGDSEQIPNE